MFRIHPPFRVFVASSLLAFAAGALAQTAPAPEQPVAMQEITVTGSRIPVPGNISATSPTQVVSSQEIELEGHPDITEVINALPQNAINAAVDYGNHSNPLNAAGGIATADLRGLGPQRTLVLVDGRRLGVGDSSTANPNPAPDLDQIPTALVERVDVVTGGASATYGSDAMAGVVNFIMKKNFEGIEIGGQYLTYQHDQHNEGDVNSLQTAAAIKPETDSQLDGDNRDLSIIMGTNTNDGAGNVTAYLTYHNQSPVYGGSRDFSNCELATVDPTDWACVNSSNSNRIQLLQPSSLGGNSIRYTVVGNQFLPWPQAGSSPPAEFDTFAYELLQRQDERYNAGAFAHLDVNDAIKPYLEVSFMDDRTTELVAPTAIFTTGNTYPPYNGYLVNCSNPLLSAQEASILCTPAQITADKAAPGSVSAVVGIGRRNIEGGGRIFKYEHSNYRVVSGLGGDLGEAFKYDAYASYYYTSAYNDNPNQFGVANVNAALQVTGTAANPVCISGGSCVPYNIFKTGGVTAAQLNYLYDPGTSYGTNTQEIQHADVTAELGKFGITSPFARDGVGANIGVEHRFEAVTFSPDETESTGQLEGTGALLPIDAGYSVKEAFVEFRAPLIQDKPGFYDLTFDAGYRFSDYSTSAGKTNTYKFEVQYAPIQDARLRISYDRAVRAPNLIELYLPNTFGQQQVQGNDPCAATVENNGTVKPAIASFTECARTGVTAAEYGNGGTCAAGDTKCTPDNIQQCVAGQCGQLQGGNSNLAPEIAETYSVGLTLTPTELRGFTASIDYFHIALSQVIGTISANVLFDGCLTGSTPSYCSEIVRTATGSLSGASEASGGYILQNFINTAAELVSGIDISANYHMSLPGDWGAMAVTFNGSWLQHNTTTPYAGAHTYDCAGYFGVTCGNGINPHWRHNLRLDWDTPWKVLVSAQWRFIGATTFDNNSTDVTLANSEEGGFDFINGRISNYSYLDLTAVYHATKGIELRAGVQNLFDKDPPIIPSGDPITQNLNIYPSYDLLGRQLFAGFKAKF